MPDCSLYLISPPRFRLAEFLPQLTAAFRTREVKAFQLRLKEAEDTQILEAAIEILPLCRAHDVAFILNDRADIAAQCGADGVHLGQEDMSPHDARAIIGPEAIIGVSAHASRDMAIEAAEAGADYVAFGAFYPTSSKPMEKIEKWGVPKSEIIEWWSLHTVIPCVAIGGITPQNCAPLVSSGADFIAVINYVWKHAQGPAMAVKELAKAMKTAAP